MAPPSDIGLKELKKIASIYGRSNIPKFTSGCRYRFGDHVQKSLGVIELYLDAPVSIPPIPTVLDVVTVDVPALLGSCNLYSDQSFRKICTGGKIYTADDDKEFKIGNRLFLLSIFLRARPQPDEFAIYVFIGLKQSSTYFIFTCVSVERISKDWFQNSQDFRQQYFVNQRMESL